MPPPVVKGTGENKIEIELEVGMSKIGTILVLVLASTNVTLISQGLGLTPTRKVRRLKRHT